MLDPLRLRYFQVVAEAGSFSRAARRLGITQPALSVQVSRLEEDVGAALLRRHRYGVTVTAQGRSLLSLCQDLFARLSEIENLMHTEAEEPTGDLRVATVQSVGIFALPETLAAFTERFPRVRVRVLTDSSDAVLAMLHNGEVDLAFTARPETPSAPFNERLGADPVLLVCGPQHRFWSRRFVRAPDLQGENMIHLSGDSPTAKMIDRILKQHHVKTEVMIETPCIAAIVRMVAMSLGLAFLPYLAAKPDIDAGRLHRIDFQSRELHRGLWASWTKPKPFAARDAFTRTLREQVQRILAPPHR